MVVRRPHLLVVILLVNTDKLMALFPHRDLVLPANLDLDSRRSDYLELPPDEQKLPGAPIPRSSPTRTALRPATRHRSTVKISASFCKAGIQAARAAIPAAATNAPPA